MRISLAQYDLTSDPRANLAKALGFIRRAADSRADLVLFPELCLSPFFPQFAGQDASAHVCRIGDEPVRSFQAACRELRLMAAPNVYLQEGSRRFDASLMIDAAGEIQGISKMVHIAQVPGFFEQDYYAPSDTGFKVYDTPFGKIGIVVCFDRHYPESIRTCVLRGAQLILIPTANTTQEPRDVFECEVRAAAFQNGVYIAMCNRIGREGEVTFSGESMVVDPEGRVVALARGEEILLTQDIDLSEVLSVRKKRPYLSLRNPEAYA